MHRHDDHEFDEHAGDHGGAVLKLGKLAKAVSLIGVKHSPILRDLIGIITLLQAPKRERGSGGGYVSDEDGEARYLANKRRREKRTVNITRNSRLPQVLFATSLEGPLMVLWNKKGNHDFRFPVDATFYPNYYTSIPTPISLIEIRDNLGEMMWRAFIALLSLMCDVYKFYSEVQIQNSGVFS